MLSLKSILCLIAMCGGVAHEADSHRLKSESATYDGRRGLEEIDWKEFMAQLDDLKSPNQTPSSKPTSRTGSWGDIVTRYPTKSPTGESIESQKQTGQITRFPTIPPTPRPTPSPSVMPSTEPSFSPSVKPSTNPTLKPSDKPSLSPSSYPSTTPSVFPSASPTSEPSAQPSIQPSDAPSDSPSSMPSPQPSGNPSSTPSNSPSAPPSRKPSTSPSAIPTTQPSSSPSAQPTTSYPSVTPSMKVISTSPTVELEDTGRVNQVVLEAKGKSSRGVQASLVGGAIVILAGALFVKRDAILGKDVDGSYVDESDVDGEEEEEGSEQGFDEELSTSLSSVSWACSPLPQQSLSADIEEGCNNSRANTSFIVPPSATQHTRVYKK